jgi:hypothetical protein
MMRIKNKKPVCYADVFWNAGNVFDVDNNTGEYFVAMHIADSVPASTELSPLPDSGPERQSLETKAMEKAAASIVKAVAEANKPALTVETKTAGKG